MKTICYIDASNLMKNGYDVDHKKLFNYLKKRFNVDIFYFGASFVGNYYYKHNFLESDYLDLSVLERFNNKETIEEDEKEKIRKQIGFIKKINSFGFQTSIKPLKIMANGKRKADCDVNITVEGMKKIENYDKFILFSGDGDFLPFLRHLREKRKEVEVYSFGRNGEENSTAKEIRGFLKGGWHDLNEKDYKDKLEFTK